MLAPPCPYLGPAVLQPQFDPLLRGCVPADLPLDGASWAVEVCGRGCATGSLQGLLGSSGFQMPQREGPSLEIGPPRCRALEGAVVQLSTGP